MATEETIESPEFIYLPLESIIVEEQIRSGIDTESESFKALMESIIERGVLNSVSHNGGKGFKGSRVQVKIKSVHSFSYPSTLSALRSSSNGSGGRGIGIYSGTTSRQRI